MFISSNSYLNKIKREYRDKKAGFSGTLDPFACGTLIVAFGQYSKLFRFLKKSPKTYRATMWLGVSSSSGDIENIESINICDSLDESDINRALEKFVGKIKYTPPKYSAKKIDGKRAYELARQNKEVKLKEIEMEVFSIKKLNYNHPFISFEATVSEGSYIRSLAQLIAKELGVDATLSYLERLNEGAFFYENQKELSPTTYLDVKKNIYRGTKEWFELGKKLDINYFEYRDNGEYLIEFEDFFSIIEIRDEKVSYILNKVKK